MNRNKSVFVVLLVLSLAVAFLPEFRVVKAEPQTIVVPDDYFTIQKAIDAASEGDTVFVKSGIYSEDLVISKSLSLVGEDKETTTVTGDGNAALVVEHDNVNVTGFTFKRPSTMRWYYGIHLISVKNCNVFGNILRSTFYGIWLFDSSFNSIYENNCTGNYHGIFLSNSDFNDVSENHVTGSSASGIGATGSNNNTITGNYVASSGWCGIDLAGGDPNCGNLIMENIVTENGDYGISISSSGSTENRIVSNNITLNGNPDAGDVALLLGWDNNLVERNRITGNQAGIRIDGSSDNTIRWNLIENNPEGGILIHSYPTKEALNNIIYENNIINNPVALSGLQESIQANKWDLKSRGNYYSSYTGTDNNGDGIGDTQYVLGKDNVDAYPLMEQVDIQTIPEFPSWTLLPLLLTATLVAVLYRKRLTANHRSY